MEAPRRVYARLPVLVAGHPLQAEVQRIRRLEQELQRITPGTDAAKARPSVLSSLTFEANATGIPSALTARQQAQSDRLRRTAEANRTIYLNGFRERERRLAEQQETEKRAELVAPIAQREREEQEKIYQDILNQLRGSVAADAVKVRSNLSVLDAQLNNTEIPLIVLNKENPPTRVFDETADAIVQQEIGLLDQNPNAVGVSMRARLERQYLKQDARLLDVTARNNRIRSEGAERIAAVTREAEERLDALVAEFLNGAIQETDPQNQLVRREGVIGEALFFEQENTSLTLRRAELGRVIGSGLVAPGTSGANPTRLGGALSITGTRQRLARLRQHLEEEIRRAVEERTAAIAQVRNLDVVLVTSDRIAGTEWQQRVAGRVDETPLFLKGLRAGTF